MPRSIAIIAGAGPGTGSAIARRFAKAYPVVLLARSQSSLDPLIAQITQSGGSAIGVPTDVSNSASMTSTIDQVKAKFGSDVTIAAAIYNVASKFTRKPFLEQSQEDFLGSLEPSVKGAFNFAQATLPLMLNPEKGQSPPTLIFTGIASFHLNFLLRYFLTDSDRRNGCNERWLRTFRICDEQVWNPCYVPISRA